MASGITLTAGVRQNLLSLQSTADMMSMTQNRLATGKKVNSALDNPSNFFTSSSLNDRASDLGSLLDSIGQATKTLDAANNGITSLTKLVQSAKSTAQQARQATLSAPSYAAVTSSGSILGTETTGTAQSADFSPRAVALSFAAGAESVGSLTSTNTLTPKPIEVTSTVMAETLGSTGDGAAITVANATTYSFDVDFGAGAQTVTYLSDASATQAEILTGMQASFATAATASGLTAGTDVALVANTAGNGFKINALKADVDMTISANSGAGFAAGSNSYNSTSLLDNIGGAGQSLTIGSTGNVDRTVNFSAAAGANNVSTLDELNTWLGANAGTGVTAGVSGGTLSFAMTAGAAKSLTLTTSNVATKTALGLNTAATAVNLSGGNVGENRGGIGAAAELTRTFNSDVTLGEIDPTNLGGADTNLVIAVDKGDGNGSTNATIALSATDTLEDVQTKLLAETDLSDSVDISIAGGQLKLDSKSVKVDFTVQGSNVSTALGLTLSSSNSSDNSGYVSTGQSTSLLDNILADGGASGNTLTLTATGNATAKTITFAKGAGTGGNVSTLAELSNYISNSGGAISGGVTGTTFTLGLTAGAGKSLTVASNSSAVKSALGLNTAAANVNGAGANRGGLGTNPTSLTRTFNSDVTIGELDSTLTESGTNFAISIDKNDGNGAQVQTIALAGSDNLSDIVDSLKANTTINDNLDVAVVSGRLTLTAKNADVDFEVTSNTASTLLNTGGGGNLLTANQGQSSSLLDNLITNGGAENQTLTIQANGGATQTITFGKGEGKVSTLADLTEQFSKVTGGVTATRNGSSIALTVASGATATSLKIGGDAKVLTQLGLSAGETSGAKSEGSASATRTSLQTDFNNVLKQIDTLAKDASYNGINLLNGDDLKVTFNENGSSSLTIKGVTFGSSNLGLNEQNGASFQDNAAIDSVIASADTALNSLRTQASKFGSTLTTVQTRQDFTKNMINTLQNGADSLVLADTNEEGANLLALQTRQQLSTTALSMANQASQAVLRLF